VKKLQFDLAHLLLLTVSFAFCFWWFRPATRTLPESLELDIPTGLQNCSGGFSLQVFQSHEEFRESGVSTQVEEFLDLNDTRTKLVLFVADNSVEHVQTTSRLDGRVIFIVPNFAAQRPRRHRTSIRHWIVVPAESMILVATSTQTQLLDFVVMGFTLFAMYLVNFCARWLMVRMRATTRLLGGRCRAKRMAS